MHKILLKPTFEISGYALDSVPSIMACIDRLVTKPAWDSVDTQSYLLTDLQKWWYEPRIFFWIIYNGRVFLCNK